LAVVSEPNAVSNPIILVQPDTAPRAWEDICAHAGINAVVSGAADTAALHALAKQHRAAAIIPGTLGG